MHISNKRVSLRREAPPRSFLNRPVTPVRSSVKHASPYPPLKLLNPRSKAPYNLPYPSDLIELDLQLIDLAEDGSEAGDLSIGHLYRVAGTVILGLCRYLGSAIELQYRSASPATSCLRPTNLLQPLLNRLHHPLQMPPKQRQTARI